MHLFWPLPCLHAVQSTGNSDRPATSDIRSHFVPVLAQLWSDCTVGPWRVVTHDSPEHCWSWRESWERWVRGPSAWWSWSRMMAPPATHRCHCQNNDCHKINSFFDKALFYSNAHCAVRNLLFAIQNTFDLKIRNCTDPHSVRTLYGKTPVCSMQFFACGNFPDSYKKAIMQHFIKNSIR